jgi:hypothetical protein
MSDTDNDNAPLDIEQVTQMHDLHEAFIDILSDAEAEFNVGMHAIVRTIAHAGVILHFDDKVTKNHFVSMVVDGLSQHYDELLRNRKEFENE